MQDLESELKSLQPSKPSLVFRKEVESKIFKEKKKFVNKSVFIRWVPLAAAACLGFLFGRVDPVESNSAVVAEEIQEVVVSDPRAITPEDGPFSLAQSNEVSLEGMNVEDEGIVYISEDIPARQFRYHFMDSYSWEDPKSKATYKVSVPREEVFHVQLTHF